MTTINNDSQSTPNIPPPPPFPPIISVNDCLSIPAVRIHGRSPNSFFIYRKAFTRHLLQLNYHLQMTQVSQLASTYWQNEPLDVKEAYQTLARDVNREINRIRQNSPQNSLIYMNPLTPENVVDSKQTYITTAGLDAILETSVSESSWDQELYGESALDWYLRDINEI
ncbi:3322_t:CDS:1 [Funneliformis geosporum]|uniref:20049_t:CDS:1 n=1 Tax=Funneliformis geosporum TaxID=1117311 RepID=A0A9W4SB33_9GLOM|nr:20049_t:CDS:1 [Funneliformis geosporum]CAI2162019.1 3322_t:CDS:1 [Funneliformis geosporum]